MKNYVQAIINEGEAMKFISSWTTPITTVALFAIPAVAGASLLVAFIRWFSLDEREKEQHPFMKTVKNHIFALVVSEAVPVILKILGL